MRLADRMGRDWKKKNRILDQETRMKRMDGRSKTSKGAARKGDGEGQSGHTVQVCPDQRTVVGKKKGASGVLNA